ncbi:MAG: alpha-mannosidase [Actinobacteria bacterium]|nr:alpha-mannosidase [Actinomycetota bacterium]
MGRGGLRLTRLLHMVGNAHIDPVWLWQWPEGYAEVRATFRSALERMDEYPDFVFTSDSVVFFAWVEETDPELFARIRERVAEGRWQVIGGWWVEPDCNIPAGESYVRQALYGQRWLRDRFGVVATTGANIDSFGHNATIPQLLRGSGMDSYVFLRPGPQERELESPVFRWESPDGSRVLAYRIPHEYCAPRDDLGEHLEQALAQLPEEHDELMVFYGVGNHGGGPTRANLDSIARLSEARELPRLELSSARRFFDSVGENGELPVLAGELQHHAAGCYTSHSGIKRWNRRAENLLQRAEKWCVVADVLGAQRYPLEQLTEAWQLLLFNQFHDTLAGTSIGPAYEDARDQLGHASSLAALAFNRAVQSISRQVDVPHEDEMVPVVVFNPHPWRLRTDVELDFNAMKEDGLRLVDDVGAPVPVQPIRPLTAMSGARGRVVFPADLPPLGYRTYRLYRGAADAPAAVTALATSLENEHVLLELDPRTGRLARLVHKATGADLAAPGPHAVVVDDVSDTWGHAVRAYDRPIGEFECTSVRLLENGPVRAVLRVDSRYGSSSLREDYSLSADARHVDVLVSLDWHERLQLLKLRWPTSVETDEATFEIPYGHLVRPAGGDEEPGQAWVDVSGEGAGLAVLNDAKYGYDVRGGDIGVSAVRSPVWAWHDPRELEPDGDFEYMDQGRQQFRVRLVPHAGDWRAAGVVRLAIELNQPAYALLEAGHSGPLPQRASFANDGGGDVVLTVVKGAEDADGSLVVRAYESAGRPARASLALPLLDRTIEADFGPHEIKTFRVPRDPAAPVAETNLLEW